MGLLTGTCVAIDGSKFKAVNNRDRNFTQGKLDRRRQQIEENVSSYLSQFDTADRQDPSPELAAKVGRLKEKIARLGQEMERLAGLEEQMKAAPNRQVSLTDPDARSMATSGRGSGLVGYNVQVAVETEHHLIVAHAVTNAGVFVPDAKFRTATVGTAFAPLVGCSLRHAACRSETPMPPSNGPISRPPWPAGRRWWIGYFDALATGPLLAKPHTARRRAGDMARICPYPDVAAASLEKVKTALKARALSTSPP